MIPRQLGRRVLWWGVLVGLLAAGVGTTWFVYRAGADTPAPPATPPIRNAAAGVTSFGYVDVEYGITPLAPGQTGRVVAVPVGENQAVTAGAALLKVDERQARVLVAQAEAAHQAALVRLEQARKLPAQKTARQNQQKAAIEVVQKRLSAARHLLARKASLAARTLLDQQELKAAEDQVAELVALEKAERARLAEIELQDPESELKKAQADADANKAKLDEANLALGECTLVAPADGTVLRILAGKGDLVGGALKQPAVLFCPAGPRLVRAEVEQEFAPRVQPGQPVVVEDDVVASLTWSGKVLRVADWYSQRRPMKLEPERISDVRTVECLIEVVPNKNPLRIGQRVRVHIGRTGP